MLMTGLFPFAEFALPAIAGTLLCSLVIEINKKTALIAYAAVAIISLIIVPNKEAALFFLCFFGYYPILKSLLEKTKSRITEWFFKLLIFNITICTAYFIIINIFGLTELTEGISIGLNLASLALLAVGNIIFIIFDIALSGVIFKYTDTIRPKLKGLL